MKIELSTAGLYAILDAGYVRPAKAMDAARALVAGGCRLIQYRDKTAKAADVARVSLELRSIIPEEVVFIVNDHAEVARDTGADGVHLGQGDIQAFQARDILGPEAIIGLSTHSYAQVLASQSLPLNYIGYGPVFKTKTKPLSEPIGVETIAAAKRAAKHPLFAIGGIDASNAGSVLRAGADGIAIVSAILESPDIEEATRRMMQQLTDVSKTVASSINVRES